MKDRCYSKDDQTKKRKKALMELRKKDLFIGRKSKARDNLEKIRSSKIEVDEDYVKGLVNVLNDNSQPKSIQDLIKTIPDDIIKSEENFYIFIDRINLLYNNTGMKLNPLAESLGLSTTAAAQILHRRKGEARPIPDPKWFRDYLERFSLLYVVSPLFLVGMANLEQTYQNSDYDSSYRDSDGKIHYTRSPSLLKPLQRERVSCGIDPETEDQIDYVI